MTRLRRYAPCLLLACFTVALLWPLCLGRTLYWGDILLYFDPMARFAQTSLRQGQIPLWNSALLCGQPFVGNPQMGVFYPGTALLWFFPPWLALNITTLLHLFLCGLFAYWFLRRWTLYRLSALAGALVYMGSGCIVSRLQFPPMLQTAAYFPLMLLCLDRCIDRPRLAALIGLALTVGLTILAAHTQIAYLIFLCSIAYGLMRCWRNRRTAPIDSDSSSLKPSAGRLADREIGDSPATGVASLRRLIPMAIAGGIGLMLAAVQVLPALQLLRESPREQLTAAQANRFVFEGSHLLTLIAPRFFGHPASADYWGGGNAWEPSLYVGWLPLLLIGYAILRCSRENLVRFWSLVALLGFWLSLGNAAGLYWLAFTFVPGLSNFHDPARFLLLTTFAFAILAACGLDALRIRKRGFTYRIALAAIAIILIPLWWEGQDWNPTTAPNALEHRPAALQRLDQQVNNGSSILAGRFYDSGNSVLGRRYIADGYSDYGPSDARNVGILIDTLLPNLSMNQGIELSGGYEPVPISGPTALEGQLRAALRHQEPNLSRLMNFSYTQALILPHSERIADPALMSVIKEPEARRFSIQFWQNTERMPCAWLVRTTRRVEGRLRLTSALAAPDFQPSETALVSDFPPDGSCELEWGNGLPRAIKTEPVQILSRTATRITLRADAGEAPAFLVYSQTAYPGWKAERDGEPVELRCANGAFTGLYLPAGKHAVTLTYRPDSYRTGVFLSLLAFALLSAGGCYELSIFHSNRRLRKPAESTSSMSRR